MQTYLGLKGETTDGQIINFPVDNQQATQMDNDAIAIKEGRDVLVPGIDGLKDIRVVNAIRKSASTRGRVEIAS